MSEIELPADMPGPWGAVGELVELLPRDWVLIGGLMVQLHALERGFTDVRATVDVDVLAQARPPAALRAIEVALQGNGFDALPADADGYAHRYVRAGLIVDVLAPDGPRRPVTLGDTRKAAGVPGGSQALARAETVTVKLGEHAFEIRRPTLLGAILIKARSLLVHRDRDAQRQDPLRLLSLVTDPRAMAASMTPAERRWLGRAEAKLRLDEPATLSALDMRRARQALRLLLVT